MTQKETIDRQHERLLAVVALSKIPSHPSIGHHYRYGRSKDADIVKRDLGRAYVEHVRQTYGDDVSKVISVRRFALNSVRLDSGGQSR